MSKLSEEGSRVVADMADGHAMSTDAVTHMLRALQSGQGLQAQFNHPEFGGMGQWSRGGLTMIGDMFNTTLKARVESLCADLSRLLAERDLFEEPESLPPQSRLQGTQSQGVQIQGITSRQDRSQRAGNVNSTGKSRVSQSSSGWPSELGQAASVGTQNDMRYAYFPAKRRLAIDAGGQITVYDTEDHRIGGFGQSQGGGQSLTFTSQHGVVNVAELRVVSEGDDRDGSGGEERGGARSQQDATPLQSVGQAAPATNEADFGEKSTEPASGELNDDQIFSRIERLADLFGKGILTQAEYDAKKAELLARL